MPSTPNLETLDNGQIKVHEFLSLIIGSLVSTGSGITRRPVKLSSVRDFGIVKYID